MIQAIFSVGSRISAKAFQATKEDMVVRILDSCCQVFFLPKTFFFLTCSCKLTKIVQ